MLLARHCPTVQGLQAHHAAHEELHAIQLPGIAAAAERGIDELHDLPRWVLDAWTETWLSPSFATWSLAPVLPRVSCPLLVIHGLHDEYGSTRHPEIIDQLTRSRPVQVEIMEDSRHMPHREHPEAVIERVKGFLEGG